MLDRVGVFGRLGAGLVESVIEDRFDAAVAVAADGERPGGGRFQADVAVALGQTEKPDAGEGTDNIRVLIHAKGVAS